MEQWRKDARKKAVIIGIDALVPADHAYICPQGESYQHKTTDRNGKRTYRSTPERCRDCPCEARCAANEQGQKIFSTHIWQEYLDVVEAIRKTELRSAT